jgi:protein SCO1/2
MGFLDGQGTTRLSKAEPRSRRTFFQALLLGPLTGAFGESPSLHGHGQVKPPLPAPDISLMRYDGVGVRLPQLVRGHVTAVQLMYTECTTTCPMGAATFARVQKLLPGMGARHIQLLSLSIDPKDDSAKAMAAWRRRFQAGANWVVAAPTLRDSKQMLDFFQKGDDSSDHSTQVSILDRNGCLVWRTYEFPAAEEVIGILRRV